MADKTPEIPVLHIYHTQDAELYRANIREDKVYLHDEKVAQFSNRGVITVKDSRTRSKKRFKVLLYLDGKADCAQIPGELQTIPDSKETIFEPLTDKDRKTVVKREIAKQLGKFKPLETWQFVVILGMLGALIAFQIIGMVR